MKTFSGLPYNVFIIITRDNYIEVQTSQGSEKIKN